MTPQAVTVEGGRLGAEDVVLVIEGKEFGGWKDVRVTRGIERMPSDFQLGLTEVYPNASSYLQIRPGQPCEVWMGGELAITGYTDRVSPAIDARSHTLTVQGRGACCDLVDCMAEWQGQQIMGASVLAVAEKLAAPFDINVDGVAGPAVGSASGPGVLIPQLVLMIGETPWEVIERLCRIAGLLAYERPDGGLRLAANPAALRSAAVKTQGAGMTYAASGFVEGINVLSASAQFGMDLRYSNYRAYISPFDQFRDIGMGEAANLLAEFTDDGVPRYRPHATLMELGKTMAEDNAWKRALWEAKRRFGRSHSVTVVTDAWRDSAGALYAPNTMARLDIPSCKLEGVDWLIATVSYRLSEAGTTCELQMMPADAFDVQPTLPPYAIPADIANGDTFGAGQR